MAKAELKTRPTEASVDEFLNGVSNEQRRADSFAVLEMMRRLSGEEPRMWGPAIVGFGSAPLKYASGREMDWPRIAFSPRKAALTLYIDNNIENNPLLGRLGKCTTGKSCLLIKKLSDVDTGVLEKMIKASLASPGGHC